VAVSRCVQLATVSLLVGAGLIEGIVDGTTADSEESRHEPSAGTTA
jgi:hypothetical protein